MSQARNEAWPHVCRTSYPNHDTVVPNRDSKGAVMAKNEGEQKGPQQHAEGQHGDAAHTAFIDGLHGKHGGSEESEGAPQEENSDLPIAGHHRLSEDREQHDEAKKNSEANRLRR